MGGATACGPGPAGPDEHAPEEIHRLSIDRGDEHLVFERTDRGGWQMVEPVDVAAEPRQVEALVQNLKDLRKSADAGTIAGSAETYGLAPPAATVRLFGTSNGSVQRPIGRSPPSRSVRWPAVKGMCIPSGGTGIEVVDAKLLGAMDLPRSEWREPLLMGVATFQVESVKITPPR